MRKTIYFTYICISLLSLYTITAAAGSADNGLPGFDKNWYLSKKLEALRRNAPEWRHKTESDLEAFLQSVGLSAEQHYLQFGFKEGLSPNKLFNHSQYISEKATALVKSGEYASVQKARQMFLEKWPGDVYLHYLKYGAAEGLNPSRRFDETAYFHDKLSALKATQKDWNEKTVDDLRQFFAEIGMTALTHYLKYGQYEGLKCKPVGFVDTKGLTLYPVPPKPKRPLPILSVSSE